MIRKSRFFFASDAGGASAVAEPPAKPSRPFSAAVAAAPDGGAFDDPAPGLVKPVVVEKPAVVEKPKVERVAAKDDLPRELFKKQPPTKKEDGTAPEKAVEDAITSEIDAIAPPEKLSVGAQAGWDALKAKAKALEIENRDLKPKYAELETKASAAAKLEAELASLRAERDEMSKLVERANIEAHPEFRRKYVDGREQLVKDAQTMLKDAGVEPDDVAAALALKGKARIDALRDVADNLPGFLQGMLGDTIKKIDALDTEADGKRSGAGEYWKEVQQQNSQREVAQREQFSKEAKLAFEDALREARAEMPTLQKVAGNDKWSTEADAIVDRARGFFDGNTDLKAAAKTALIAESAKPLLEMVAAALDREDKKDQRIAEMEAELKKMHGGGPRLAGAGSGAITTGGKKPFSSQFSGGGE